MTSTVQGHSEACCTLPIFTDTSYIPKGEMIKVPGSDMDAYVTGEKGSEIGLICIYDIFGE